METTMTTKPKDPQKTSETGLRNAFKKTQLRRQQLSEAIKSYF